VGRTTIVLDDGLIKRAMRVSGAKTKQEAVDRALREMVARGRRPPHLVSMTRTAWTCH